METWGETRLVSLSCRHAHCRLRNKVRSKVRSKGETGGEQREHVEMDGRNLLLLCFCQKCVVHEFHGCSPILLSSQPSSRLLPPTFSLFLLSPFSSHICHCVFSASSLSFTSSPWKGTMWVAICFTFYFDVKTPDHLYSIYKKLGKMNICLFKPK